MLAGYLFIYFAFVFLLLLLLLLLLFIILLEDIFHGNIFLGRNRKSW